MTRSLKSVTGFLGAVLVLMFIAAISGSQQSPWLYWLDLVLGLCAFAIAGLAFGVRNEAMATIGLSIALFALWIVGLSTGALTWLVWWTFAVACAMFLTGVAGVSTKEKLPTADETRFRRSA